MAPSIGLNLRVTGYCNQGGRKYMEDVFSVAYQQTEDEKDLEYAFFGIFDGHGGREAALFAKEHLMDFIVRQKSFWGEDDEGLLRAIRDGFIQTHQAMWRELETWPKTASGLPSTAGTTASIAFIRRSKIYVGHVGDSAIVLGVQDPENPNFWRCEPLTRDHKPESIEESKRIARSGGKVICKSGVPRVVWNRPKMGHKGPIRRSTPIDEIPFLAVARSLGDLWSYNSEEDVFVVSPEPDTYVYPIDILKHRCLILGTDGAWNMISPQEAVSHVCQAEKANEQHTLNPSMGRQWINPSKRLVDKAIEKWNLNNLRADNTSVVTVMLDPPGPPRAQVLKRQRELAQFNSVNPNLVDAASSDRGTVALVTNTTPDETLPSTPTLPPPPPMSTPLPILTTNSESGLNKEEGGNSNSETSPEEPPSGVSIISRCPNSKNRVEAEGRNLVVPESSKIARDYESVKRQHKVVPSPSSSCNDQPSTAANANKRPYDGAIQCNEISSSDDDSVEASLNQSPLKSRCLQKKPLKEYRLSRELSALKMDSGPIIKRRRKNRTDSSSNTSDTENEEHSVNRPQKRTLRSSFILPSSEFTTASSHSQCKKKKSNVSADDELNHHFLRSSRRSVLTLPNRKRKQNILSSPSKSPKVCLATKKPVVTRSRSARVLQLKK